MVLRWRSLWRRNLGSLRSDPFPYQWRFIFSIRLVIPESKTLGEKQWRLGNVPCCTCTVGMPLLLGGMSWGSWAQAVWKSLRAVHVFLFFTCKKKKKTLMRVQPITLLGKPTPSSTCKHLLLVINMFAFREVPHTK